MSTVTVPVALVRAAMLCQADIKKDMRRVLCGILLAANGDVVGTNGGVLFKGFAGESRPDKNVIVRVQGTVPPSSGTVRFEFNADGMGGVACTTKAAYLFTVLEGPYPDYLRVIPPVQRPSPGNTFFGDPSLLALAGKIYGQGPVTLRMGPANEAALFTYDGVGDLFGSVLVVMPRRF